MYGTVYVYVLAHVCKTGQLVHFSGEGCSFETRVHVPGGATFMRGAW